RKRISAPARNKAAGDPMSQLVPCVHCARHVRVAEVRCPFCRGVLPGEAPARAGRGRMSRAAMLAVGATLASAPAGCADDPPTRNDAGLSMSDASDSSAPADGGGADADAALPDAITLPDAGGGNDAA